MAGRGGAGGSCLHRGPGNRPLSKRAMSAQNTLLAGHRAPRLTVTEGAVRPPWRSPLQASSHRGAWGAPTRRALSDAFVFSNQISKNSQRPNLCFSYRNAAYQHLLIPNSEWYFLSWERPFRREPFLPHDLQELCSPAIKLALCL